MTLKIPKRLKPRYQAEVFIGRYSQHQTIHWVDKIMIFADGDTYAHIHIRCYT